MRSRLILAIPAILSPLAAGASSEEAWAAFRADVEAKCLALAPETGEAEIEVNPFGSERFGVAILTVRLEDGAGDRMVCIYDKQAQTVELTAPFAEAVSGR